MHGSGLGYQAPSRDTMHSANSPSVRMPRPMIVIVLAHAISDLACHPGGASLGTDRLFLAPRGRVMSGSFRFPSPVAFRRSLHRLVLTACGFTILSRCYCVAGRATRLARLPPR